MPVSQICYSEKYYDGEYEYRHVILPKDLAELVPKTHLMTESEWRNLGVQQSPGWVHYSRHEPGYSVVLTLESVDEALFKRDVPYAIWNPDFHHTRARYSSLFKHLDLTNFSSGTSAHFTQSEERGGPPTIHYSLKSTSRFSYRDPSQYNLGGCVKWPSHNPHRPEPDGPALGIIPRGFPRISDQRNVVNVHQGSDEPLWECGLSNAALREIWRTTGNAILRSTP